MIHLLTSLAGLLLGPISFRLSRRREELYGFLDGFVLVGVSGLILTEVIPETVAAAGYLALAFAALGFVLPFLLERRLSLLPFSPNLFFRWLMILGLFLHQLLDGMALSDRVSVDGAISLRLAVILHQIPKGFFIWGMVGEAMGPRIGKAVIGSLCLATAGGFALGDELAKARILEASPLWLFQAFIGGGLLHVILHHVPKAAAEDCGCGDSSGAAPHSGVQGKFAFWSGAGAIVSLGGLLGLHFLGKGPAVGSRPFISNFLNIALESAPSILLGFAAAGLFQTFLPRVLLSWFRGRGRMSQALGGVALGLPLPICSCGVVPVYLSLLKKNVPPAAALAFLIATPEIGIDSFFLSGRLLGIEITLIRLGMAFLIALAVALSLARIFEKLARTENLDHLAEAEERPVPATIPGKLRESIRFGALEIVDHTGAWLLAGIAIAALIGTQDWQEFFRKIPQGIDVLLLSLLGLPLYVCASGATPLAAILIQKGISPGAALAFLITGPSSNVSTFGILKRCHGLKGAILFPAAVYGFSIACGFAINHLFPATVPPIGRVLEDPEHGTLSIAASAVLGLLFAGSLLRLGPRGFLACLAESIRSMPSGGKPGVESAGAHRCIQ